MRGLFPFSSARGEISPDAPVGAYARWVWAARVQLVAALSAADGESARPGGDGGAGESSEVQYLVAGANASEVGMYYLQWVRRRCESAADNWLQHQAVGLSGMPQSEPVLVAGSVEAGTL